MKRRKRTNYKVPAKARMRDMADRLWSLAVRRDWGDRCAVCGKGKCEAHHLIPRQNESVRYHLRNGIALCPWHHKFDPEVSPHQNAAGWMDWLESHHYSIHSWYAVTYGIRFTGVKNADYFCGVIRSLRQCVEPEEFERIVGVRFSAWLEEEE